MRDATRSPSTFSDSFSVESASGATTGTRPGPMNCVSSGGHCLDGARVVVPEQERLASFSERTSLRFAMSSRPRCRTGRSRRLRAVGAFHVQEVLDAQRGHREDLESAATRCGGWCGRWRGDRLLRHASAAAMRSVSADAPWTSTISSSRATSATSVATASRSIPFDPPALNDRAQSHG